MAATARNDAITDVPGIKVGHWTDRRAATGCSVVLCEGGAVGGVDVRGGAPGTIYTDALRLGAEAHAVLLTGGSVYGLEAASGVTRWLEERGIGLAFGNRRIPIVAGAVIFDLNLGNGDERPNAAAGYAAASRAKAGRVQEGSVGGGTGATVAKLLGPRSRLKGGLGTAAEWFGDGLVVGALAVVNAIGDIIDSRDGSIIAGSSGRDGGFADSIEAIRRRPTQPPPGNTTNAVVATNAALTRDQVNRLASVSHDGLARAIRPVHTLGDGDTVFALSTGEREASQAGLLALQTFAALAVERAIVKGVTAATSLGGARSVNDR